MPYDGQYNKRCISSFYRSTGSVAARSRHANHVPSFRVERVVDGSPTDRTAQLSGGVAILARSPLVIFKGTGSYDHRYIHGIAPYTRRSGVHLH